MAYTYEELKGKTIDELREIAKGVEHEAVKGFTQMNKEHLLPGLCKALGVEMHKHPHHRPTKKAAEVDKSPLKARLRQLKAERDKALGAHDGDQLKAVRRQMHRLRRQLRAAAV